MRNGAASPSKKAHTSSFSTCHSLIRATTKESSTSVFITDVVLQLLSYVAQMERDNIKQRQAEGIASAKARGVRFGRPKIERPGIYEKTKHAYEKGSITRREAADRLKVSVTTFDTWMKEDRKALLEQTA